MYNLHMVSTIKRQEDDIEDILSEIPIPENKLDEITHLETAKTMRGAIFTLLGIDSLTKLIDQGERIKEAQQEWKRGKLLQFIMHEEASLREKQQQFEKLVTDPQGNILYNKVIRLLDDEPPNAHYIKLLANTLKKIRGSDFNTRFSEHSYVLNQIEKLTTQALLLLSDYSNWPEFIIGSYRSDGEFLDSSWVNEFLLYYAPQRGIKDKTIIERMAHSFLELEQNEMIRSKVLNGLGSTDFGSIKEDKTKAKIVLTIIAREILSYIE
jgi:hypothetical protein